MDSLIQFYEIKKVFKIEKRYGKLKGEGIEEYKAARWGVFASFLGPITTIIAPWVGVLETSRTYAFVAIVNANVDNLASTFRKVVTNWINAKAAYLKFGAALTRVFKDPYVFGNLLGSLAILLVDLGGRSLIHPTMFEFLGIVAVEGMVIGMLDTEITALWSKATVIYQNRKWQKLFTECTFRSALQLPELGLQAQIKK